MINVIKQRTQNIPGLNNAQTLRKQHMDSIVNILKEADLLNKEISTDLFIRELFDKRGLSPNIVRKMFLDLVFLGKIEIVNNIVKIKK